jgi:CPA1 family monovalent cation:H+ antiporter
MAALELVLVLLAASIALQVVARRFAVPQPALLVLGGALIALVPGLPRPTLDPDLIFLMFVPPLIYSAAVNAPVREFTRHARPILLLSVGLVLVTTAAVAVVGHALWPKFTWAAAFVLGAVVAAPDPVAAMAVMRPLRAPAALTAVLEGEGIFNDATALVAYRIALAAALTGSFSLAKAGLAFAWTGSLGVVVGLALGWAIIALRQRIGDEPLVDSSISLLSPFAVYVTAEALGASGILAVVVAGLYIGHQLRTAISPAARVQAGATWALAVFILESLVFILIGLELPVTLHGARASSLATFIGDAAIVSLAVIVVRIACVAAGSYVGQLVSGRGGPYRWKRATVLAWTGVRGAESIVLALALPHVTATGARYPGRNLTIVVAFGVVFVTLVLQGLTVKPLIRLLRLDGDPQPAREEAHARHLLASAGLRRLDELAAAGEADWVLAELRERHQRRARRWETHERRLGGTPVEPHDGNGYPDDGSEARFADYRRIRHAMILAERGAALDLRDRGIVGADVLRRIEHDLDLETMLMGDERSAPSAEGPRSWPSSPYPRATTDGSDTRTSPPSSNP